MRLLPVIIFALFFGACSTTMYIPESTLASINSGKSSMILVNYGGQTNCQGLYMKYTNVSTGTEYDGYGLTISTIETAKDLYQKIELIEVPPGKYTLSSGECYIGQYILEFDNVKYWFEPFDVYPGEVVYPGTFITESVSFRVEDKLDFIPEGLRRHPTDNYQLFSVKDKSTRARLYSSVDAPRLADNYVSRPMKVRVKAEKIKKILEDAYSTDDEAKDPNGNLASKKAEEAINEYITTGIYPSFR